MSDQQLALNKTISAGVALLWTKRNRPDDETTAVKVWKRVLTRHNVTPKELEAAVDHFLESSPFFPDVSEVKAWIYNQRKDWPTMGVLVEGNLMSIVSAPTVYELEEKAREKYAEAWGCLPADGRFDCAPRRELAAKPVAALPEPAVKEIPDLEDPEQESRIREQIDRLKTEGSIG